MENTAKERYLILDILKGIGMLIIILTHFEWASAERLKLLFPFWVEPAVPIFIIISGYVYSISYEKNNIKTLSDGYNLEFVSNKIIRYTVPFLIAYLIEIIYWLITNVDVSFGWMIFTLISGGSGPGSYYYPIMMQFIFAFPFIYFGVKRYDFAGVILGFIVNGLYEIIQRSYGMSEGCYRLLLFRYIFLMSFGCYMYLGKSKPKKWIAILSCIVGVIWLVVLQYLGYQPKIITYWPGTCLFAALWITPIAWKIIKSEKIANVHIKPLEIMGRASYNIFLTQMVFYDMGVWVIYKFIENRSLQLILCLIINSSVGVLFYLIENKITKRILKIVKKMNIREKIETCCSKIQKATVM